MCVYCVSPEQIQLSDVRFLVVDEADTLFDRSFQEATTSIIRTIKVGRSVHSHVLGVYSSHLKLAYGSTYYGS